MERRLDVDLAERLIERGTLSLPESADAVTPAMDPVIERGQIVGGFEISAMDAVEVEPSAEDDMPGDEALLQAIQQELREDASTNGLSITVEVEDRVAHLGGKVSGPEDAENAEATVRRVPGVQDVIEELEYAEGM